MTPEEVQNVKQAIQEALTQGVGQIADQVAQQVGQAVSQAITKLLQTQAQTTGASTVSSTIRETDIAEGERATKENLDNSGIIFSNKKRTYDEYQNASLETIKENQRVITQAQTQLQKDLTSINNVSLQLLQNAVENANILGKKVAENVGKSGDIATDRMWNVDEQGYQAASILDAMNAPAVKQAMAATIADILAAMAEKTKAS